LSRFGLNCTRLWQSQGEDALVDYIFDSIGVTCSFCVEFGANGCGPTWRLRKELSWQSLLMDIAPPPSQLEIHRESVTAENINLLFSKYGVPPEYDFLSVDVDGNDYWVWRALDERQFSARVVCIEYNCHIPPDRSVSLSYDPHRIYQRNKYYGASAAAFYNLGFQKGYSLVCVEGFLNLFFIRNELLDKRDRQVPLSSLFHYPIDVEKIIREQGYTWRPSWINAPDPDLSDGSWVTV
jgi:hypothetical protein